MDIREKLVELLKDPPCNTADEEDCANCKYRLEYFCGEEMMADILIANGVTVQEWIPVSEPPPLFCAVSGYCPERNNVYEVYLNARGEWHFFDKTVAGALLDEPITHWSPLPQPPKK